MLFKFCVCFLVSIIPHPLIQESSEVCLFVPNLKKGKREDHEPTIEYYKDLLEKHEIKSISQVSFDILMILFLHIFFNFEKKT